MYYVYLLLSEKDGNRYIGSTNNLNRRLREHANGKVKSTRSRRPLNLLYFEAYETQIEATTREKYFKTHKGYNELKELVSGYGAVG